MDKTRWIVFSCTIVIVSLAVIFSVEKIPSYLFLAVTGGFFCIVLIIILILNYISTNHLNRLINEKIAEEKRFTDLDCDFEKQCKSRLEHLQQLEKEIDEKIRNYEGVSNSAKVYVLLSLSPYINDLVDCVSDESLPLPGFKDKLTNLFSKFVKLADETDGITLTDEQRKFLRH